MIYTRFLNFKISFWNIKNWCNHEFVF